MKKAVVLIGLVISVSALAKDSPTTKNQARKPSSVQLGDNGQDMGNLLSTALADYVKKSGKYAGMGQGWTEYYIGVRCAYPEGTGNSSDKANCHFVEIK